MRITQDVDLPDEVIDAHKRGDLVFFVGAGASVGTPSNLPLFNELARQLAGRAAHPPPDDESLDFFIGKLESVPQGFDAHHHTRDIISNPESKFNPLHEAIVKLAGLGGEFRVVTTNYDNHLASAAGNCTKELPDIWYAPALPLGRDFAGLVHLHGSVRGAKENLILNDRDFGRAYITDAWAVRFLLPMFEKFTIVFIGYSHDDLIMRYLALGLPSSGDAKSSKRFAFTNDPTDSKWRYLGIRPIDYPVVEGDHVALVEALGTWANHAKMGLIDHRSRVQAIVAGGTALPLPDRDYLLSRIRTKEGANDFSRATAALSDNHKIDWLVWLERVPEFQSLFSTKEVTEATEILGTWFARNFIDSTTLNGAGLQTIHRLGQSLSDKLYHTATAFATDLIERDKAAGYRWHALLATSIYGQSAPLKNEYLIPLQLESMTPSMAVLQVMLRPYLRLRTRFFEEESSKRTIHPDVEIDWNSEESIFTDYLQSAVMAADPGDLSLGSVLECSVAAAYDLIDEYNGERSWDSLSRRRSAIERHAQDNMGDHLDAIIDGLRDYGVRALPVIPYLPDRWWASGYGLMQRLALYLVTVDPARSADDKLSWLLDRTGLFAIDIKHEIFQLLATSVVTASPSLKTRVLEAVSVGHASDDKSSDRDNQADYEKYNLLAWLVQADPDWTEVAAAFDSTQAEHPHFAVREYPDLNSWMIVGTSISSSPVDIDDFVSELAQNGRAVLDDLLNLDCTSPNFDQPRWRDALELVRRVVENHPDLGVLLWDELLDRDDVVERRRELWRVITNGWGNADLKDVSIEVFERLFVLLLDNDSAQAIGRFLLDQISHQADVKESPICASMRKLAVALWLEHGAQFSHAISDPLSFASLYLNSWPGFLARYWNCEVNRRWLRTGEEWTGLTEEESNALVALLNGNQHALDAIQPAIAGELFFYFSADANFAETHLYPIFEDPLRHNFGWVPFLRHSRCNDQMLAAGFFDIIVSELDRLEELPEKTLQVSFLRLVTSVLSFAEIPSADRNVLLIQTVLGSGGANAVSFAETVVQFLQRDCTNGAEVWRCWLGEHLKLRLQGQPRNASPEELSCWADIVPLVGEYVPSAAGLFAGRGVRLSGNYFTWKFPDAVLDSYGPELVDLYADRVRVTPSSTFESKRSVRKLVEAIVVAVGEVEAYPLVEEATNQGFIAPSE